MCCLRHDANAVLQKLTELVALLTSNKKPQHDVFTLESILNQYCTKELADDSPMGKLLKGPSSTGSDQPMWSKAQLAKPCDDLKLPNGHWPTVGCKQVSLRELAIGNVRFLVAC